jgi:outer membrane protein insertion porin family
MKSLLRRSCILLALLVYWLPASAQTLPVVRKIEIKNVGPPAASDDLIKSNIRIKEGDTYSRTAIDDDVRNLYNTGYFYNIRVTQEPTDGGVKLVYVVQGKMLVTEIKFEGNKKYSTSKLRNKIKSKVGEPMDERKLFNDAQEILKYYQKSGYQKTDVKYVPDPNEQAGRVRITFEITEAPKIKIENIVFDGATAFKQKKIAKQLKTRKHWMWSWLTGSGVLKDEEFEDDKEKLYEFYRNEGYIDFEIKEIKFDSINPKWMVIRFVVNEGKQYHVGTVEFKGNTLFTADEIRKGVPDIAKGKVKKPKLLPGSVFSPEKLSDDIDTVRDFYGARGYIDAKVFVQRKANTETGNMDLSFQIDEKDKSYIEKIEIKGNTKTKDKVIRRELAVSPGEVYDRVRVDFSKERLKGLQYFDKVAAQDEPTDVPNRRNLVVAVEEKNTGNVSVGAGFSSVESIVGFVELTQSNFDIWNPPYFTGAGQRFRIRASYGSLTQDYRLSIVEPWFLDKKLALSFDLFRTANSYQSTIYDVLETGGRIGLERALFVDYLRGGISYTLEEAGIKVHPEFATPTSTSVQGPGRFVTDTTVPPTASPAILSEDGEKLVSKIGTSLAYDTRQGIIPRGGQKTELITEVAGGPLGAQVNFYKMELHTSWYFPGFWSGHIFEVGGKVGTVVNFGSSPAVRLFDRYFLGGPRSLRGFKYASVGPHDSLNDPFGGDSMFFTSAEYSIPIIDKGPSEAGLRVAFFYDIGNVYARPYEFNLHSFDDDYGVGLRLNIPHIGPLRLDLGIPIHTDAFNSSRPHFQFDIGFSRDY